MISFNGTDLSSFGVYVDPSKQYVTPEKDVEYIEIPGRNGTLTLSNNRFTDVTISYPCYFRDNFVANYRALEAFLYSVEGFARLESDKEPLYYRMASFVSPIDPEAGQLSRTGKFTLTFRCHPQRFLKSGETATDVAPSSTTSSGSTVSVPNPSGLSSVSDLKVSIDPVQDLNGLDAPYPAGGGGNLVDFDEVVTALVDTPLVQLTAGTYYLYVANEKTMAFNSYAQYSTDGTTFANISTSSEGVDVYTNQVMNYNTKKCILTVVNPVYVRVRIQTNANLSGATVKVLLTKDSTNYSVIPNAVYSTNADFQAIYKPYSNICPITGRTQATVYRIGKNLLPNNWVTRTTNGVTFTPQPNGRVRVYGTATDYTTYSDSFVWTGDTGVYYFNGCPDGSATTFDTFIYDADAGQRARKRDGVTPCDSCYSGSQEVLLTKGTRYLYVIRVFAGQTMTQQLFAPMIRRSADDAYYDQHKGSEFTIDLNGTIYGGTLDVTTGVMTVDRKSIDLGEQNWVYNETYTRFQVAVTDAKILSNTEPIDAFCSMYRVVSGFRVAPVDYSIGMVTTPMLLVHDSRYTDVETFKTAVAGQQLVYKLKNPQTVQLTAQQISLLQGSNYINASTGDVEITVSTPGSVTNPTLFESKPIIRMYGNGTVNIGNVTITVANSPFDFVDLDCETMDAHYGSGNANPYVSLSTDDFITLKPGENYVTYSGFTVVRITPRWYEI